MSARPWLWRALPNPVSSVHPVISGRQVPTSLRGASPPMGTKGRQQWTPMYPIYRDGDPRASMAGAASPSRCAAARVRSRCCRPLFIPDRRVVLHRNSALIPPTALAETMFRGGQANSYDEIVGE